MESTVSFPIIHWVTLISFRNVMPSANSSSWWKPGTLSWVNLTWSLCLWAPGIWVTMNVMTVSFTVRPTEDSVMCWIRGRRFFSDYLLCCFVYTGGSPPRSLESWVTCCGLGHTPDESTALLPHDIYALGTQENPQGEREWTEHIKATLRSYTHIDFKQVILLFQL